MFTKLVGAPDEPIYINPATHNILKTLDHHALVFFQPSSIVVHPPTNNTATDTFSNPSTEFCYHPLQDAAVIRTFSWARRLVASQLAPSVKSS